MDGDLAKLPDICQLADQHGAAVGIDDCHATGHLGATGRGAAEELGVLDRIDIITGTLGKTLGGASGGFTAASAEIVDWLRNRSRPYLFSNSVPPALVIAGMKALELVDTAGELRARLKANTKKLRAGLEGAGFTVKPGPTPILPVMLGDAAVATKMADELLERGIYVIGFSYPVVPQGQARIRIQVSAAHTDEQLDRAIAAFKEVGKQVGVSWIGSLPRPDLAELDHHPDRRFHLLQARPLQRRVRVVLAGREVRRRQSLRRQHRAVGAAADDLELRLQPGPARRLRRVLDRPRLLRDPVAHVPVLLAHVDLHLRLRVLALDLPADLAEQLRLHRQLRRVEVAEQTADLHLADAALDA